MIHAQRMTAQIEGDFVVFLIGMRLNQPWKIHKWLPVAIAMPRMLKELKQKPEMGLLHADMWFARNILVLQYWRSVDQLLAYAKNKEAEHLPAWRAFNQKIGQDGSVGIWHETYVVRNGQYESMYVNMPEFGLGEAGQLFTVEKSMNAAADRIRLNSES